MASNYSANQYDNSFKPKYLQNWCLAKESTKLPETHDGYTQIIANDRGHLLPSVPRSKTSPWGTFMSTWKMPLQIPPARVTLTTRSASAANRLISWVQKNPDLLEASNGLRPDIQGHPQDPAPPRKSESIKVPGKTPPPKAVQEIPQSPQGSNTPPSRGLPAASPAPLPPQNQIPSRSNSCTSSSKTSPDTPMSPEACHSCCDEPVDQEIQERNMENDELQQ
uniref:Protein Flattop n=1 Tax=Monodelphis domestica TaxID=13616 RepID=A0A5F8GAU4_MONDO